jgi:hypothetical protein
MTTKKIGRPALPPGKKKVQVTAKVMPATAEYLTRERARTGKSLGALLEEAVALMQTKPENPK